MKVLTYTSYKEHCDLYTEIHGSIAVNSCQIELAQKDIILLSSVSMIVYKTGKLTGVEKTKIISFDFSVFASGVGLRVGFALGGTSLLLSLATAITRKSFKIFTVKQEKYNAIKLLAQSKLDSMANIISHAMQDGDISPTEFHKVLQKLEKYRKLKADIRNQVKAKVKEITKEQREE